GVRAAHGAGAPLHALVIGNSDYEIGRLNNPVNDAKLMDQTLRELGFTVDLHFDLNQQDMDQAIDTFARKLPQGSAAFFLFAGHGVEVDHENFLIPVNAHLANSASVRYRTTSMSYVRDVLEQSNSTLNVLILDCCRDNPFTRSWGRNVGNRGLAPMQAPEGMVIAFSTSAGATASDGDAGNSPYSLELSRALSAKPADGLLLFDVFRDASRAVKLSTGQIPWLRFDATLEKFYLRAPTASSEPDTNSLVAAETKASVTATPPFAIPDYIREKPQSMPQRNELLVQGDRFHNDAKYDLAIEAYTAVIENASLGTEMRNRARLGRGGSFLARRTDSDLERAIIDYKAAGKEGVRLSVLRPGVTLRVENRVTGRLQLNEVVLLTTTHDDWFWVRSVMGNQSRKGFVKRTAFEPMPVIVQAKSDSPQKVSLAESPTPAMSQTVASPRQGLPQSNVVHSSTVPSSSAPTRPIASSSGSSQRVYVDANGRVIASPQSSQAYSPQRGQNQTLGRNSMTFGDGGSRNLVPSNSFPLRSNQPARQSSQSGRAPAGADAWTQRYFQKHGRAPSIWETPKWESPNQIKQLRARGLVR
ncbi:MAG: caspase family protein, partial [Planctomycetota bacterium]